MISMVAAPGLLPPVRAGFMFCHVFAVVVGPEARAFEHLIPGW